jgi:hypothetical protein
MLDNITLLQKVYNVMFTRDPTKAYTPELLTEEVTSGKVRGHGSQGKSRGNRV